MRLNAEKPDQWDEDIARSVELFNDWFLANAPKTFREERQREAQFVRDAFIWTADFTQLTPEVIEAHPRVVETFRMATTPQLARDRLIGISKVSNNLVQCLER